MSRSVLVVDDDDDIREIAATALEVVALWQVRTAHDGRSGIEAARDARPDVILLDVMMPDMDGPTTFKHLQEDARTADIPVILLTAKVGADAREQFQGLGVRGVITKPFSPLTLASEVADVLGWSDDDR